jgi:hypothetical protein
MYNYKDKERIQCTLEGPILQKKSKHNNVTFRHPVALYRSECGAFCAVQVQPRSLFFLRILLLDTTCFGRTGHLHVYRLSWLRILLPNIQSITGNKHQIAAHNTPHTRGSNTTDVTKTTTTKDYDGRPTRNWTPAPGRTFNSATSKKSNKTRSNHMQPKDTQIILMVKMF